MKNFIKILIISIFSLFLFWLTTNAKIDLQDNDKITNSSIKLNWISQTWDIVTDINKTWISILTTIKVIFEWVLIIYIVYIWVQMILSMWTNDEELSKSKRSIWHSLIWIVFINIPWTLYNAFKLDSYWSIDWRMWYNSWVANSWDHSNNILINTFNFWQTLNWDIIWFIEVAISAIAILMIIVAWIRILTSRWKEEDVTKSKDKIIWSLVWLVFISFIEAWKWVIYSWNINDWWNLFEAMSNLSLFFAWPVAIAFLTLAAYYYITANDDEERIKKAKSIIVNTLIATVLLLAAYTFLLDLANL